ncbi:MAG: hypothetical protein ABSE82_05910 [Nitrososphaerales archaeon]|jgi:hypothetical protein
MATIILMLRDENGLGGSYQNWTVPDSAFDNIHQMICDDELKEALDELARYGRKDETKGFDASVIVCGFPKTG